jgi:DNA-binding transcriptional MocR family regulator
MPCALPEVNAIIASPGRQHVPLHRPRWQRRQKIFAACAAESFGFTVEEPRAAVYAWLVTPHDFDAEKLSVVRSGCRRYIN